MKKKIRVLHIITDLPIGGAQDNTLYTLELLDRNKYSVSLACNMSGELVHRAELIPRCRIHNIKTLQRDVNLLNDFKSLISLVRLIRQNRYDIVHTHSSKPGVIGRIAAFITGTPLVIHTVHGFPFHDFMNPIKLRFYIAVERLMNIITTHLITVSTLNLKKIVHLKMAHAEAITNIYSGIDIAKFRNCPQIDFHAELKLPESMKIIGFVGRFSDQKDPLTFLQAISQIASESKDCHIVFVGDGPLKRSMISYVEQNDLTSRVSFLGYRLDINSILHGLDLFVLSSIYEGLGRSVTEALCCKIPVVATAVEGVPELVQHKKTGLLVEPNNPDQLARAIIYALNNLPEMKSMAEAGNLFVEQHFQVKDMVGQIDVLYKRMIQTGKY